MLTRSQIYINNHEFLSLPDPVWLQKEVKRKSVYFLDLFETALSRITKEDPQCRILFQDDADAFILKRMERLRFTRNQMIILQQSRREHAKMCCETLMHKRAMLHHLPTVLKVKDLPVLDALWLKGTKIKIHRELEFLFRGKRFRSGSVVALTLIGHSLFESFRWVHDLAHINGYVTLILDLERNESGVYMSFQTWAVIEGV